MRMSTVAFWLSAYIWENKIRDVTKAILGTFMQYDVEIRSKKQ